MHDTHTGPFRAWSPATAFHGVWDSAGPARSDCYCGQRSLAVNGPRTWNSLPADLKTPDTTLCSFKRHLKAHLFQQWASSALLLIGGSAPFVRHRCDCLVSSAPFINTQTYILTYLLTYLLKEQDLLLLLSPALHPSVKELRPLTAPQTFLH